MNGDVSPIECVLPSWANTNPMTFVTCPGIMPLCDSMIGQTNLVPPHRRDLAGGGLGVVYEAEETELGLLVARNGRTITLHSRPLPHVLSEYSVSANLTKLPNSLIFYS